MTRNAKYTVAGVFVVLILTAVIIVVASFVGPSRADTTPRFTQAQHDCYVNAPTQLDADACIAGAGR